MPHTSARLFLPVPNPGRLSRNNRKGFSRLVLYLLIISCPTWAQACPECRGEVWAGVWNADFARNLTLLLLPIAILLGISWVAYFVDGRPTDAPGDTDAGTI